MLFRFEAAGSTQSPAQVGSAEVREGRRMLFALRWNSRKSFTSLHCASFLSILSPSLGSLKGFLFFGGVMGVGRLQIHWNLVNSVRCYNPEGKAGSLISGYAGQVALRGEVAQQPRASPKPRAVL